MIKDNLIQQKSFDLAIEIINLYKYLKEKNEFVLSKQLLRSATSIGANIEESIGGQTKKDFLAKIYIALKKARETKYRLKLLDKSQTVKYNYTKYMIEIESIINILTKISKTTAESLQSKKV
ncbi:MAG: four helix bundle protein [candidate division SR1 bacterium CG_4_9_14_3_um_filter_40_9]|nr:MAG: four helix bundle protein [candidate division SR1 bacterium CG_4_9_14_3_um_filter_40_9]